MPEYFDFHCHIAFSEYEKDREEVLSRMQEQNIWGITVGTDFKQSREAVAFASEHKGIFSTVGLHPADNKEESFEESAYADFASNSKVLMVGECGLDYHHEKEEAGRKRQRDEFEKQIEFAVKYAKPLMLHVRDAHKDAIEILTSKKKEYGDQLWGNAHFFTLGPDEAKDYYTLDFTTSFPGVITFATECADTVRYAPKDMIHAETDAPYAAPVPHRGKRNEPAFVIHVVEKIAELRGEDVEEVKRQLINNAWRVLKLEQGA